MTSKYCELIKVKLFKIMMNVETVMDYLVYDYIIFVKK